MVELAVTLSRNIKTGRYAARFLCAVALLALSVACNLARSADGDPLNSALASAELARVRTLIEANVIDLAQRIMEQQGPPLLPNGEWLNWERQLWALYRINGDWQQLVQRVRAIPPSFPAQVHREADREAVVAYNAMGDGVRARRLLRRYLVDPEISERDKPILRRQVIESYLAEDRLEEASIAALQFQQDFRPQDRDWLLLGARISMQSGNPAQAVNLLAPLDDPEAQLLRLWARLKDASLEPDQVLESGSGYLEQEQFDRLRVSVLAVMAGAAQLASDSTGNADLLEQYLKLPAERNEALRRALPVFTLDDLVTAYRQVALDAANEAGYLAGDEGSWHEFIALMPVDDTVSRRASWGYISSQLRSVDLRQLAVDNYVNAAIDGERSYLVQHLFGNNAPLGTLQLSPATALRLSNRAIELGDVQLAADANSNVSEPPPGMAYEDWLLYTGRISIIAGRYREGAMQLEEWLAAHETLDAEQTDSVLQPVFDLQTVGQHAIAISLLEKINHKSPGGKYPREIAFWIAESYSATGAHLKAADYFLYSAMQKDNGYDQWGQAARYRAADALLAGNFFSDARNLYQGLLKRANEDARARALNQKLQQVWLRESSLQPGAGQDDNG